jgi:hypothetical protein
VGVRVELAKYDQGLHERFEEEQDALEFFNTYADHNPHSLLRRAGYEFDPGEAKAFRGLDTHLDEADSIDLHFNSTEDRDAWVNRHQNWLARSILEAVTVYFIWATNRLHGVSESTHDFDEHLRAVHVLQIYKLL